MLGSDPKIFSCTGQNSWHRYSLTSSRTTVESIENGKIRSEKFIKLKYVEEVGPGGVRYPQGDQKFDLKARWPKDAGFCSPVSRSPCISLPKLFYYFDYNFGPGAKSIIGVEAEIISTNFYRKGIIHRDNFRSKGISVIPHWFFGDDR